MVDILIFNFTTIILIIGLGMQLLVGKAYDDRIERKFLIGLVIIILQLVCDGLDTYLAGLSTLNNLRYVTSILGYLLRPSLLFLFICILLRESEKTIQVLLGIPIILETIIVASSPFTNLVFYFGYNNDFHRGPMGYLPHIIGGIYILILIIIALMSIRIVDRLEVFTVLFIAAICTVAILLETAFGYRFLLPGAMITSCVIYYVYLYTQTNRVDLLTGLLNRRSLFDYVNKQHKHQSIIVSIDLNNLKEINNTKGYEFGDLSLRVVANGIKKVANKKYKIYRIGGDEFIALGVKQNRADAIEFIKEIKKEFADTEYRLSIGYSLFEPKDDFNKKCLLAEQSRQRNREFSNENIADKERLDRELLDRTFR